MNRMKAFILLFIVMGVMLYRVLLYSELQQTKDITIAASAVDIILVITAIGSVVYSFISIIKDEE